MKRFSLVIASMSLAAVLAAGVASAAKFDVNESFALGGSGAPASVWFTGTSSGCNVPASAFSPASDATVYRAIGTAQGDAFDGGLLLAVDGAGIEPSINDDFRAVADTIQTPFGPGVTLSGNYGGLRVTRTDAVQAKGAAIMRTVVTLKNSSNSKKSTYLTWDSNLGSDSGTGIRKTSSGDNALTVTDRWVVSSDTPGNGLTGDPAVTHVFYGKGNVKKLAFVDPDCKFDPGDDALSVRFNFSVPKKSTKYFVFFTELHYRNDQAVKRAKTYNSNKKIAPLFKGLSKSTKKNVLNWDL